MKCEVWYKQKSLKLKHIYKSDILKKKIENFKPTVPISVPISLLLPSLFVFTGFPSVMGKVFHSNLMTNQ